MAFPVENRAQLPDEVFGPLAAILAQHRSFKHAIDWLSGHTPPIVPGDLVEQDEFSYDFLVEYSGRQWLVYSTT